MIAPDAAALRQRLSVLDPSDRATADPRAQHLLSEADVLLEDVTATSTSSDSSSTSSTPPGTADGSSSTTDN